MTRLKREISATEKAMGEQLRELRRAAMTQVELADRLRATFGDSIRQSSVSDWETGRLRLHGELIAELCRILETDANTLLGIPHPKLSRRMARVMDALVRLPKRKQDELAKRFQMLIDEASG